RGCGWPCPCSSPDHFPQFGLRPAGEGDGAGDTGNALRPVAHTAGALLLDRRSQRLDEGQRLALAQDRRGDARHPRLEVRAPPRPAVDYHVIVTRSLPWLSGARRLNTDANRSMRLALSPQLQSISRTATPL